MAAARPAPVPRPASSAGSGDTVQPGDSLSQVAAKTQVSGISLDQMLVGLFRQNPSAFIESNMNRLRAGAVLQVPDSETLNSLSPSEARQVILAQSADFGLSPAAGERGALDPIEWRRAQGQRPGSGCGGRPQAHRRAPNLTS